MLVSVVIPVHNRPLAVRRAVHSALAQCHAQVEIIVVDDGSTDDTLMALKKMQNSRLNIIRQENKGVSAARNRGLREAQGELLALLDSDDAWLPQKTARHTHYHREGGWRISQTDEIWVRNGRRVNPGKIHAKQEGHFFAASLRTCLISPSCVIFDRDLWEEIGPFDEELPACEDYDLWLRTLSRYPVGLCPQKLVVKTGGHADQLSRKIIGLDLYRLHALDKLLRSGKLNPEQKDLARHAMQTKANLYIRGCLKRDKPDEALRIKEWIEKRR
ncbi:MAG TPA: glycosyltransferase family 2 protein [Desulfonatronum sp.]|nr:glycosyltransferase family 2 protein [Desulfonatronum sp.]